MGSGGSKLGRTAWAVKIKSACHFMFKQCKSGSELVWTHWRMGLRKAEKGQVIPPPRSLWNKHPPFRALADSHTGELEPCRGRSTNEKHQQWGERNHIDWAVCPIAVFTLHLSLHSCQVPWEKRDMLFFARDRGGHFGCRALTLQKAQTNKSRR